VPELACRLDNDAEFSLLANVLSVDFGVKTFMCKVLKLMLVLIICGASNPGGWLLVNCPADGWS